MICIARFAAAITLLSTSAMAGQISIRDDEGGGVVQEYLARLDRWDAERQRVVIEGLSARCAEHPDQHHCVNTAQQ